MIPQETVNRILDAAQITDVVGDFVSLKRQGADYSMFLLPKVYISASAVANPVRQ